MQGTPQGWAHCTVSLVCELLAHAHKSVGKGQVEGRSELLFEDFPFMWERGCRFVSRAASLLMRPSELLGLSGGPCMFQPTG